MGARLKLLWNIDNLVFLKYNYQRDLFCPQSVQSSQGLSNPAVFVKVATLNPNAIAVVGTFGI